MNTSPVHGTSGATGARGRAISPRLRGIPNSIRGSTDQQYRHGLCARQLMLACIIIIIVLHAVTAQLSTCNAHRIHAEALPFITTETQVDSSFLHLSDLPPAAPAEPWRTLNESLLPYPVFYPAIAVLNNSILLLGGCVTATCATPVGTSGAIIAPPYYPTGAATSANSPYHERVLSLNVEKGDITTVPQLTLPAGLGFAGRYAAVTLTDSVYVVRSCTMTTLSPAEVVSMKAEELQAFQATYAPVVAFYPEGTAHARTRDGDSDLPPAVNLTYFEVPADRVRVNASCTALSAENKLLIIGGFLLSEKRITASVDSFNVVTRKYEADVTFLSVPVLHPSVAASTGFAAVAGGWTYKSAATASGTRNAGALQEQISVRQSSRAAANGELLHLTKGLATAPGKPLSASHSYRRTSPRPQPPTPSSEPPQPVTRYLFDLLFFEPDRLGGGTRAGASGPLQAGGSICVSPVDPSTLPRTAVEDILLSLTGCHVAAFGGQVVLADHNLSTIAALDIRSTFTQAVAARAKLGPPPPPPVVTLLRTAKPKASARVFAKSESATSRDSQASSSESSSAASMASSSSSSPTPPPEYRYSWMQPTLVPLAYSRPPAMTSTILLYYALGGEDVWVEAGDHDVLPQLHDGPSTLRATLHGTEVVARQAPTLRWAQRELPDLRYDGDRPELLALAMPTPVWPEALILQANSEGIIHLTFPDVNYTQYCRRNRLVENNDDNAICTVRLSSRRDCVGNTAGTLDSAYDGSPNATILFSVSGSTTPVYVCFSYVVRPALWPTCRITQSFSILNPMMPLSILDNSHTTSAPTSTSNPSPTVDPADKTTSSPLFMLAVGVSVVTLLVAVLLAARLQQVPEDGLLVMSLLDRGDAAGAPHANPRMRGRSCSRTTRETKQRRRTPLPCGSAEPNEAADAEEDDDIGLHPTSTYADFLQVVGNAQEDSEARMLMAAADVLRLHQHRYHVLSRIGRGAHSLCFLAKRKAPPPPSPVRVQQQRVRGAVTGMHQRVVLLDGTASPAMRSFPFTRPPLSFPATSTALSPVVPAAAATSSLWAARHDQSTAVVVKYTQCPDDATRAVITRLCERLRDLQADAVTEALDATGVYKPDRNSSLSSHPRQWHRPPKTSTATVSVTTFRSLNVPSQLTRGVPHKVASGDGEGAAAEAPKADVEDATVPAASRRSSVAAIVPTASQAGCQPLPPLSSPVSESHVIDGDDDDDENSCAWLDAHEANVVLSLFLLLPEDLFVSYEVSVLHQQASSSQQAHAGRSGHSTLLSVSRAAMDWNRRHIWPGANAEQATVPHNRDQHQCTAMASAGPSFHAPSTPRVCWEACVNPLQPSTVRPWSLCLVMPYERSGDLASFILRCQQMQLLPSDVADAMDSKRTGLGSSSSASSACVPPVHHCWTESLLCSILFQVCTGLQLLHAQSPPILHGNIKQSNVLLREPTSFAVAQRRVVVAGTLAALSGTTTGGRSGCGGFSGAQGDLDTAASTKSGRGMQHAREGKTGQQNSTLEPSTAATMRPLPAQASLWRASSLVAAATAVWQAGSPVLHSSLPIGSPPSVSRAGAAVPPSTAALAHSLRQDGHPRKEEQLWSQEPARHLLSTHTYLPISLTDGGMSWWLTVQLPVRLRGCFGRTIRSTLRQTPAGLCWLRRLGSPLSSPPSVVAKSGIVPPESCVAALAHFLFTFIEVPTNVAPELLWGRLCTLSQSDHGDDEGNGGAGLPASGSSLTQSYSSHYGTRSRREQYGTTSRRDGRRRGDGDSVTHRHSDDCARDPAGSPVVVSAIHARATASDHVGSNGAGDKQALGAFPQQQQRHHDPCADEDVGDGEVELGVDEDGIFTREEVNALTSAMWKAEGLTRVPRSRRHYRHAPPQKRPSTLATGPPLSGAHAASTTTPGGGPVPDVTVQSKRSIAEEEDGRRGLVCTTRGLPSSFSATPLLVSPTTAEAGVSAISSPHQMAQPLGHHQHGVDGELCVSNNNNGGQRMTGGGGRGGGGASVSGEGSRSSSSVYEVLIQRVLAMDTASDIWSLGVLLYCMCADGVDAHQQPLASASTATSTPSPPHVTATSSSRGHVQTDVAGMLTPAISTCTSASKLAQRALAALLGDLYDLAVAGVPSGSRGNNRWSCDGSDVEVEPLDEAVDDRLRWPRSCALEDEVMQVICNAGYTQTLASVLASMLSPVAARRPSARDIVNQLRLVTAAAPAPVPSKVLRSGGDSLAEGDDEYSVAQQSPLLHTRDLSGASEGTSWVMLHEQTARMALRR